MIFLSFSDKIVAFSYPCAITLCIGNSKIDILSVSLIPSDGQ